MTDPLIVFDRVTKTFRDRTSARTLRDALPSALAVLTGRGEPERTRFTALDQVSFAVAPGEALGIIGRNGAGKSTTLKLAAGVYRPDSGRVSVKGRVASMIELSAGFHPDLSGRENVFLNAALLGLRRSEIQALLPRIVEFSGIEEFIEAPLRVYSSGMAMRLGFAVAAHVPAQALLVDEVLAVGDLDFFVRCIDRMAQRRKEGVSVLFVSHHLAVVEQFCDRVVIVDRGKLTMEGPPVAVIDEYRRRVLSAAGGPAATPDVTVRRGTGEVTITGVECIGPSEGDPIRTGLPFTVRLHLEAEPGTPAPTLGIEIHSPEGAVLVRCLSRGDDPEARPLPGNCTAEVRMGDNSLQPGAYVLTVYARDAKNVGELDLHSRAHRLAVEGTRPDGDLGAVTLAPRWKRPG